MFERATLSHNLATSTKVIGEHLHDVSKRVPVAYKLSATAAGFLTVIYAINFLQGDTLTSYLSLAGAAFSAGAALNQYNGSDERILAVRSAAAKPYNATVSALSSVSHSFFGSKASETVVESKEEDKPTVKQMIV